MAKEIPYFRFTVQEWQNEDITLMDFETQGVFINTCCFYWLSDCSLTLAKLKLRLPTANGSIESLLKNGVIKHDDKTDFLEIDFLNEQFDVLSEKRKKRQKAGSKGGKAKASNAKAMLKQNPSYKDKDKDKDNIPKKKHPFSESPYYDFNVFKEPLLNKCWSIEKIKRYYDRAEGYSKANGGKYLDWIKAVQNWDREKPEPETYKKKTSLTPYKGRPF